MSLGGTTELIISGTFFALSYSKRDLGCLWLPDLQRTRSCGHTAAARAISWRSHAVNTPGGIQGTWAHQQYWGMQASVCIVLQWCPQGTNPALLCVWDVLCGYVTSGSCSAACLTIMWAPEYPSVTSLPAWISSSRFLLSSWQLGILTLETFWKHSVSSKLQWSSNTFFVLLASKFF